MEGGIEFTQNELAISGASDDGGLCVSGNTREKTRNVFPTTHPCPKTSD